MANMIRWFGIALLLLLAPSTAAAQAKRSGGTPAEVAVEVVRTKDRWTANFTFSHDAPAWIFARSALPRVDQRSWRLRSWTVETPGVRLERRGHYDTLLAARDNVPRRVRISFKPFGNDILSDYDPALIFTDGSVALFTQQWDALPLPLAADAAKLPVDLTTVRVPQSRTRVTFRDAAGPVLHNGRRVASATHQGEGTYVLFGNAQSVTTDVMTTVIDPELPAWIRNDLQQSVPKMLDLYAASLGPAPGPKPTVMVSWAGPTKGVTSMGGSVLPGLIVMTYEGEGVVEPRRSLAQQGLWFIGHEGAHFWLGQAVRYERSAEAWITEGGANLLAIRAVAGLDPSYDWRAELQKDIDDCIRLSAGRGVASAEERNEHRAYYACGSVFALVAEAASRGPFIGHVRRLIDANRADGVVSRADWIAALDRAAGSPTLGAEIGRMLDRGAADPKAAIASLFERSGVPFRREADGRPRLQ